MWKVKKKNFSQTKLQRRLERVHGKEGPGIGHVSHASSGLRSGGKKTLLLPFYLFIPAIYALVVRARRAAFRSRSRRFPPFHNRRVVVVVASSPDRNDRVKRAPAGRHDPTGLNRHHHVTRRTAGERPWRETGSPCISFPRETLLKVRGRRTSGPLACRTRVQWPRALG